MLGVLRSMATTFTTMMRKPVTIQYPTVHREIPERAPLLPDRPEADPLRLQIIYLPQFIPGDIIPKNPDSRIIFINMPDHRYQMIFPGHLDQFSRFPGGGGEWLLHQNMFAPLHTVAGDLIVSTGRSYYHHRVRSRITGNHLIVVGNFNLRIKFLYLIQTLMIQITAITHLATG